MFFLFFLIILKNFFGVLKGCFVSIFMVVFFFMFGMYFKIFGFFLFIFIGIGILVMFLNL